MTILIDEMLLNYCHFKYGHFIAIENRNLEVVNGEALILLRQSGCGKTSIMCCAGLEEPTSGRIVIDDVVVLDSSRGINLPRNQRNVGLVFQSYALRPSTRTTRPTRSLPPGASRNSCVRCSRRLARAGTAAHETSTRRTPLLQACVDTDMPEATALAGTIEKWWPESEGFSWLGNSNARTEGYNRVIKAVKRVACGFRNQGNLREAHHVAQRNPQTCVNYQRSTPTQLKYEEPFKDNAYRQLIALSYHGERTGIQPYKGVK